LFINSTVKATDFAIIDFLESLSQNKLSPDIKLDVVNI
jgi:hypothetical protein